MATKQDARGVIATYGYDSLNRLTSISYNTSGATGAGTTPNVTYNYDNNPSSSTNGLLLWVSAGSGYSESYAYDSFKRVQSVTRTIDGHSYTTSYQQNTANQPTQMTYPSGRVINLGHDSKGRVTSVGSYLTGVTYNNIGQLTGTSLGNGVTESNGYDANRMQLTTQTATKSGGPAGGLMSLTYNYQASAGQMGAGSTAGNAGQLMSISGTIGGSTESAAYTYDDLGRLFTSNQTSNGSSAQRRFAYDRWGNRTGMWDAVSGGDHLQAISLEQSAGVPTNRIQAVSPYNNDDGSPNYGGWLDGADCNLISGWAWDATQPNTPINLDIYDGNTLIATVAANQFRQDLLNAGIGNGVHGYSIATPASLKNGAAHTIHVKFAGTSAELSGSPKSITCSAPASSAYGGWLDGANCNVIGGWAWDANQPNTPINVEIYDGNTLIAAVAANQFRQDLLNAGIGNGYHGYAIATPASLKKGVAHSIHLKFAGRAAELSGSPKSITCGNYIYDACGSVTNDGQHSYTYDGENRLVSVDGGATGQYAYDPSNRRYKKVTGGATTHYIWQGSRVITEYDGSTGALSSEYVYSGSRMIAKVASGTTQYFIRDRLSVRLVLDASGNVLGRQGHLPFGEDFGESGTQEKHHFTGYERDGESGTDYAVNRQYSFSLGSFTRVDPMKGYIANPQSLDRYSYVKNNPTNSIDPKGLLSIGLLVNCSQNTVVKEEYNEDGSPNFTIGFGKGETCDTLELDFSLIPSTSDPCAPFTRCCDNVSKSCTEDAKQKLKKAVGVGKIAVALCIIGCIVTTMPNWPVTASCIALCAAAVDVDTQRRIQEIVGETLECLRQGAALCRFAIQTVALATLTRFSKNERPPFAMPSEDIVMRLDEKVIHSSVFKASASLRVPLHLVAVRERLIVEEHLVTGKATLIHSVVSCLLLLILAVPLIGCAGENGTSTPEAARAGLGRRGIDYSPSRFVQSAKEGNSKIIELFLAAGMDPDARDDSGKTALMLASEWSDEKTLEMLLAAGASVSLTDNAGLTALHYAAGTPFGNKSVRLLLERGADPNAKSQGGRTPAMGVMFLMPLDPSFRASAYLDTLQALLDYGADVNAKNNSGVSVLMFAAMQSIPEVAQFLIDRGADVRFVDKSGRTAKVYALSHGNNEVAKVIEQAGG